MPGVTDKSKIKKQRMSLLRQQSELYLQNCSNCSKKTKNNSNGECEGCDIYTKLQKVGEHLENLKSDAKNESEVQSQKEPIKKTRSRSNSNPKNKVIKEPAETMKQAVENDNSKMLEEIDDWKCKAIRWQAEANILQAERDALEKDLIKCKKEMDKLANANESSKISKELLEVFMNNHLEKMKLERAE